MTDMTLPLEKTIIEEIGFYCDPFKLSLDDDPNKIAREAAEKLPGTISKYHELYGNQIDAPYEPLIGLLSQIAAGKKGCYTLMSTYLAAADIIKAHIQAAYSPNMAGEFYLDRLEILQRHVPQEVRV